MDYLSSTKTLFVGTNQKSILTINIEKLLDPLIRQIDFTRHRQQQQQRMIGEDGEEIEGEDGFGGFDLDEELELQGYQPGLNL